LGILSPLLTDGLDNIKCNKLATSTL